MQEQSLNSIFDSLCLTESDINEHLPTLYEYASHCNTIVELGVRSVVSTFAFLKSNPKSLLSIDITHPYQYTNNRLDFAYQLAKQNDINFEFILADSRSRCFNSADLLFIDTYHNYRQVKDELNTHHKNVNKYIIFHDTQTYGFINEDNAFPDDPKKGLIPAIMEFVNSNPNWAIRNRYYNNNGLLILNRIY